MKKSKKDSRPTWDEYFMSLADVVGQRGTCDRGKSGCVIMKDKRILTTGYVGAPMGLPHCDEAGHEMHKVTHEDGTESMHCIRTVHAEQNAIVQAARIGISLEGSTLYCKMTPCYVCAKLIINSGIVRVVASKDYHAAKQTKRVFKQAKIKLEILNKEVETYANMK
ncbi:MAG: cell division protein DedD [Candidatus Taylorbacteria bacterium]|nr:cell division protein DedD [Candidatus Taylorbacteria bacterium]